MVSINCADGFKTGTQVATVLPGLFTCTICRNHLCMFNAVVFFVVLVNAEDVFKSFLTSLTPINWGD